MDDKITVGITHGDINGISYEVILQTLVDNRLFDFCTPILYGSAKVAAYHRKALNIGNFSLNSIKNPEEANPKRANLINCVDDNVRVELGKSTHMAGEASLQALMEGVKHLKEGRIDVIVTAPIDKHNIQSKEFTFPGHTEYFQQQFESPEVLMLMVSELMKVGVVTGHVPLEEVPGLITSEAIMNKLKVLNRSLIEDFAVRKPKIAVLGLNPHAGDNGLLGKQDMEIILPVLNEARENGIFAFGPYPADGFFGAGSYKKFDAVLAMYHDQGLIPFKALDFGGGVNFTAGLPVVRTSPAHGTAYELAGKGEASDESFRHAVYLACDIYRNRQQYAELTKDPLTPVQNDGTSEGE